MIGSATRVATSTTLAIPVWPLVLFIISLQVACDVTLFTRQGPYALIEPNTLFLTSLLYCKTAGDTPFARGVLLLDE